MLDKKKQCSLCQLPKSLKNDFSKKKSSPDGKQNVCKDCAKEVSRQYYTDNKKEHKANVAKRKTEYKKILYTFLFGYFSSHPCIDCGETDVRCLEFDHVYGNKKSNISTMLKNVCSLDVVKCEIEKCEVRCANCHRKRTADVQGWYKTGL